MRARLSIAALALLALESASADDIPVSCLDADRNTAGPVMAIALYSQCLAQPGLPHERVAQARYRRGLAYQTNNQMMEAATDLREALALKPQWAEAHRARALVMMAMNEQDEADEHLTAALRVDPDFAQAHKDRAVLRRSTGDYSGALEDIWWALRSQPVFAEAYLQRGLVYTDERNFELARDALNQAIALNPGYAEALEARGETRQASRNYEEAIDDYSSALSAKHPQPWSVLLARARVHEKMRNRLLAIADLHGALELNPQFEEARAELHRLGVSANSSPSASAQE